VAIDPSAKRRAPIRTTERLELPVAGMSGGAVGPGGTVDSGSSVGVGVGVGGVEDVDEEVDGDVDEVVGVDVGAPVVVVGRSATIVLVVVVPASARDDGVAGVVAGWVVVGTTVVDVDGPPVVLVA